MRSRKRRLWSWLIQILVAGTLLTQAMALPEVIKVGGLFETTEKQQKHAFERAIKNINSDRGILQRSTLEAQVEKVSPHDSFGAYKAVCRYFNESVAAIFGPPSPSTISVLQSSCDTFKIPLIQTHWDYKTKQRSHAINLFPNPSVLAKAYADFIIYHHWKTFALIYEDNEALIRLQELLKVPSIHHVRVTLRYIKPGQDFKKLMKDLMKQRENNFVVDLSLANIRQLFKDAGEIGMMTEYQNYMLTTLDIQTETWENSLGNTTNVTALSLVNPNNNKFASQMINAWKSDEQMLGKIVTSNQPLLTEAALIFDGVALLARALEDLDRKKSIDLMRLSCNRSEHWHHGNAVVNYMKMMAPMRGITGDLIFDENGQRTNFVIDIIRFKERAARSVGTWDPKHGIVIPQNQTDGAKDVLDLLRNKTLTVTAILGHPYIQTKKPESAYKGNDLYEGYCKDLLDKIQENLHFKYEIKPVKDGKHGKDLKNGQWDGMIGELLRGEADIAIGDLTITSARENAVDFTMPFMNLGISILFKKPAKKIPPLFSFLQPLSLEVWFYMATAFLGVSLFLFILARLSPYEWVNPHPCDSDNDTVENQFNLLNSFWFAIGSIMQQGSDLLPRAISTRIVASSWWFFTLIMISSYTANLAAFLTAQRMTAPIENAEDLSKQTKIDYGCNAGGSTMAFFKNSTVNVHKRMWEYMADKNPSVFTKSNDEGIDRVMMGNYAFLMESTSIEYSVQNNCELTKIGGELDTKGYGIATRPGSPFRNALSSAVLKLQEDGNLHLLKEKWWKEKSKKCPDDSGPASAEMGVGQVGGVFLVLFIGTGLGCIVVLIEFAWKAKRHTHSDPMYKMLWNELRLIASCRGSARPVPPEDDEGSVDEIHMMPLKKVEEGESYS